MKRRAETSEAASESARASVTGARRTIFARRLNDCPPKSRPAEVESHEYTQLLFDGDFRPIGGRCGVINGAVQLVHLRMSIQQHLSVAPIVEAALDIRIENSPRVDMETLAKVQERLPERFSTKQIRMGWEGRFEIQPGSAPVTSGIAQPVGYLFPSRDGTQVVQAALGGFTFSQLRPYGTWSSFAAEARSAWEHFAAIAKPKKVIRIALRYINRIEIPLPLVDLKEYLRTVPEIGAGLPQGMSEFFFRVVIPIERARATAVITETIDTAGITQLRVPVVLDIDIFREGTFPLETAKLWPLFDPLHEEKNRVFFESITDKTVELYK